MFFNEEGILNMADTILENASFKRIVEDGVVTDEEVKAQTDKVMAILHKMEEKYTEEQIDEINQLLAEMGVLYAVYNFHTIQNIEE